MEAAPFTFIPYLPAQFWYFNEGKKNLFGEKCTKIGLCVVYVSIKFKK